MPLAKKKQKNKIRFKTILKIEDPKNEKLICDSCKLKINSGSRFARLQTYDLLDKHSLLVGFVEEKYYHMPCWAGLIEKLVRGQFQASIKKTMKQFNNFLPMRMLSKLAPKIIRDNMIIDDGN